MRRQISGTRTLDECGRNGIHPYAVTAELVRERARQLRDRGFDRAVYGISGRCIGALERRDVHDRPTASAVDHAAGEGLTTKERGLQIQIHARVEIVALDIEQALHPRGSPAAHIREIATSVVHERISTAHTIGGRHHRRDALGCADVHRDRARNASSIACRCGDALGSLAVDVGDHHRRSGIDEQLHDALADTLRAARHNGDGAGQAQEVRRR
jgi:hypothetical protein